MSVWRRCGAGLLAGAVLALAVAACGSSGTATGRPAAARSDASGSFPVRATATLPRRESLAADVTMTVSVVNTGHRALPDVAVSVCNTSCAPSDRPGRGTAAQAFGYDIQAAPNTADPSRPLWIVQRGPGACHLGCNASGGSLGGGVTASSNTWALGRLAPGATTRFTWRLEPVESGRFRVAWQVAGDLTGRARAIDASGGVPNGTIDVTVASAPPNFKVTPSGRVETVTTG